MLSMLQAAACAGEPRHIGVHSGAMWAPRTGVLVLDEVDVHQLAVLREDGQQVALREVERQAASKDVGRVLEARVPGGALREALRDLVLAGLLRVFDLCQRIHGGRCLLCVAHSQSASDALDALLMGVKQCSAK
jgi:hypothetical protein